jgi:hypothetical protein
MKADTDRMNAEAQKLSASAQYNNSRNKVDVPKTGSGLPIKPLESGQQDRLTNIANTAYTIEKMAGPIKSISTLARGPITGWLTGKNPYAADIQVLNNLINQVTPSMARGIFGEVGVLTDKDVERYKKMLPQVKTDPKVATAIYNDIKDKVDSAYKISVGSYKKTRDVSGYEYPNVYEFAKDLRGEPLGTGDDEDGGDFNYDPATGKIIPIPVKR